MLEIIKKDTQLQFTYTNWRGEVGVRNALVIDFYFGNTEHHPDNQILLEGIDLDKKSTRIFAVKDMKDIVVYRDEVKLKNGDRVRFDLLRPYTSQEIVDGCDPNIDGKTGTIIYVPRSENGSYEIELDNWVDPCPQHLKITYFNSPYKTYTEKKRNLKKIQ